MKAHRVLSIAVTLVKSQLRAGRSGRWGEGFLGNPAILAAIDAVCFGAAAAISFAAGSYLRFVPEPFQSEAVRAVEQGMVFTPALVPSVVLVAGVLFELSTSSRFASSDAINWLPVGQGEYVAASVLSIAYFYSAVPSIVIGATLGLAVDLGYGLVWAEMAVLSCVSLVYGGATVEILRAAVNRVGTAVMRRARKGALVLRLVVTVGVILALQVIFNFVLLLQVVGAFASSLDAASVLPVLWASAAVRAGFEGDTALVAAYSAGTLAFSVCLLACAALVRSRYWSPVPSTIVITTRTYEPGRGPLASLGFSAGAAALVAKDMKGLARRRELLQYFSIPFVLAAVLLIQVFANPTRQAAPEFATQFPVWFVGGIFGLIVSSISFGQEGRSAILLYSLPVTKSQVLHAKVFTACALSLLATLGMAAFVDALSRPPLVAGLEDLATALVITVEQVFIGLALGARYADFQERPRPRFVEPIGILVLMVVGISVMLVTALPAILRNVVSSVPGVEPIPSFITVASFAFALAVAGLAYRWAGRETSKLLTELRW